MSTIAPVREDGRPAHDLGPFITRRARNWFERTVFIALLGIIAAVAAAGLVASCASLLGSPAAGLIGIAFSGLILWICALGIRSTFRVLEFHERGLIDRCFGKRREFLYDQTDWLEYSLTRNYVNGFYCGTELVFSLRDLGGRKLRFTTRHKEKAKGLTLLGLGRKFEGDDEMDVIRDVIAAHIAQRLTDRVLSQNTLEWPGLADITAEGITPRIGRCKRTLIPWNELGFEAKDGFLYLFAPGHKRSVIALPAAGRNFYAMTQVIATLASAAGPADEAQTPADAQAA